MAARTPTCLSCIRRLTTTQTPSWTPSLQQVRYKSKKTYDQGVIVRLLEDIPKYGRKDAIFRVERGRMRNLWYPTKKAEYMTVGRFAELGLSRRDDVGERDPMFRAYEKAEDVAEEDVEGDVSDMPVFSLAPERIHALLMTLVPEALIFHRKPIHTLAAESQATSTPPKERRSPLLAHHDPEPAPTPKEPEVDLKAIFGSVSTADVLASIKAALTSDSEAIRIPLELRSIRFTGEETDRVKQLGEFEVQIAVPGASELVPEVQFVRRRVEVVPVEETASVY